MHFVSILNRNEHNELELLRQMTAAARVDAFFTPSWSIKQYFVQNSHISQDDDSEVAEQIWETS